MAASLLPDVTARITPQMGGGGGGAEASLLPDVNGVPIRAQLGGKPVKVPRVKGKKQSGGALLTDEEKVFANLFKDLDKKTKFTEEENKLIEKYVKDTGFINKITESLKKDEMKEDNNIGQIYERLKGIFNRFIATLKNYINSKEKDYESLIKIHALELENGRRVILLNDYIETKKLTKNSINYIIRLANALTFPKKDGYIRGLEAKKEKLEKGAPIPPPPLAPQKKRAPIPPPPLVPQKKESEETVEITPISTDTPSKTEVVETMESCYAKLRAEMAKENPDFTDIIQHLYSEIPKEKMKDILYDPSHAPVRQLLREMITLKVNQFKDALKEARGEWASANAAIQTNAPASGINVGTETEIVATVNTAVETNVPATSVNVGMKTETATVKDTGVGPNTMPKTNTIGIVNSSTIGNTKDESIPIVQPPSQTTEKTDEEEYKQKLIQIDETIKEKLDNKNIKYGGVKAADTSDSIIEKLRKNDRNEINAYYGGQYEFQSKLLCGLHALNNLFIEERKEKGFEKLDETLLNEICNIMKDGELIDENGCPTNGYYSIDVMVKILKLLGYNVEYKFLKEVPPKKEIIDSLIKDIKENNLGFILGSGGHWTALRRLNNKYVDFRNSIIKPKSSSDSINISQLTEEEQFKYALELSDAESKVQTSQKTIEDYTPEIYNINDDIESIFNLFNENRTKAYIIVSAGSSSETPTEITPVNARIQPSNTASIPIPKSVLPPSVPIGGAKTRHRRSIRPKKTKRREKK